MSIAYNVPLATVDGNVFRVWSRLNDDYRDIKLSMRKSYEQEFVTVCYYSKLERLIKL